MEIFPAPENIARKGFAKTRQQALDIAASGKKMGVFRTSNYNSAKSCAYRIKRGHLAGWQSVGTFNSEVVFDQDTQEYVVLSWFVQEG